MEFLNNLERLMASYNMNRSDLARACGLSYSAVSSWWNRGYENISLQTLLKLSNCFNCTIEALVHGEPKLVLLYDTNEYTESELKLISIYANYLKSLRGVGLDDN